MKILHVGMAYGWWGRLRPDCLDNPDGGQVGGGETAMLNACFQMAAAGHDVHLAFRCAPGRYKAVRFHDIRDAHRLASEEDWDVVVSWDDAEFLLPLRDEPGILKILSNQMNHIAAWAIDAVDLFVSPSRTHARLMAATYGIPLGRFAAIPNGVDPSRFDFTAQRDPYRVYYASSPDRGLHHLLAMWPEIRAQVPEAQLHVYYEVDRWIAGTQMVRGWNPEAGVTADRVAAFRRRFGQAEGVVFEGAVHPRQVAQDACRSAVMAYPCDTVFFTEGFGTAVLESYVAGAYPVVTDTDAFAEVYTEGCSLCGSGGEDNPLVARERIETDFAARVVEALRLMRSRTAWGWNNDIRADVLAGRFSWDAVGKLWHRVLDGGRPWWPLRCQAEERKAA